MPLNHKPLVCYCLSLMTNQAQLETIIGLSSSLEIIASHMGEYIILDNGAETLLELGESNLDGLTVERHANGTWSGQKITRLDRGHDFSTVKGLTDADLVALF